MSVLRVEHLTVSFDGVEVFRDLTFSVPRATTLAIIGPNGAGKTVLLRSLVGAIPSTGLIQWAPGTRIGYVPQKLDLERDLPLTGLDLLAAKVDVLGLTPDGIADALAMVALPGPAARRSLGRLSGGELQRLLLAFALLGNPTVVLFDEPTAGLDEPGTRAVYELLRRLQRERGLTVILISHDLSVVYEQADNVLCLSHAARFLGRPTEVLTPEHLQRAYGGSVRFHLHDDALAR